MNISIGLTDQLILVTYLALVTALGILWRGRTQSLEGYFLGDRNLRWWAILGSIVATETSTVTFLSIPGIAFKQGGDFRFLQLALGYILGRMLIAVFIMPQYFRGRILTAYQLLGQRLGRPVQRTASLIFLAMRNLADGLRLFLTAIVLREVARLDLNLCILIVGMLTIVYTYLGGMRSVIWNDCVQLVVYLLGAIVAGYWIIHSVDGGFTSILEFAQHEGKLRWIDWDFSWTAPYTVWSGLIAGVFISFATHGVDQLMVQRYLSARSSSDASWALGLSGVVVAFQFWLFLSLGIGLACFYKTQFPEQVFEQTDRVFADFIVNHLPTPIAGLTLAAVFSAAMSTLSSSLNSSAGVMVSEFPLRFKASIESSADPAAEEVNSAREFRRSRIWTLVFGLIQMAVAASGIYWQRTVVESALSIAGISTGVLLGTFFLAMARFKVDARSATLGMLAGLGIMISVYFATKIAWPWYSPLGAAATVAVTLVIDRVLRKGN